MFLHFHSKCNFHIFRDEQRPKLHMTTKIPAGKGRCHFTHHVYLVWTLKHFAILLLPHRYIFVYLATEVPNLFFLSNCC